MTDPLLQPVPPSAGDLTVIVPAYNEAEHVADTIRSLKEQTSPPARVLVIDDGSTDGTGDVTRALDVDVLRPASNTGSKAGAQTYALPFVDTPYVMAIDADTTLAPDAIERLLPALRDPDVAAACGFVLPRHVRSLWERGRYLEYLFAFGFVKQVQDYYERPLISSGCFSTYRTDAVRAVGGWSNRTMAEDMDLTWSLYQAGRRVRFVPEALCYPVEPHDLSMMRTQLRRWSHGFVQNVALHWRGVLGLGYLRSVVAVAAWDAVLAGIVYLLAIPLLAALVTPWVLLAYVIDLPAVLVPALAVAARRGEVRRTLASVPGFLVLRLLNSVMMLRAMWAELVVGRRLVVYEKGH